MKLNEVAAAVQKYLEEHPEHADLPVCAGDELADTYMNEVHVAPLLESGEYADDTSTRWNCKRGDYITLFRM